MPRGKCIAFVIIGDHSQRVQIRVALESLGHFVISSASGAEAVLMLDRITKPTIIIISSNLPLMPAEQVLSVLRVTAGYEEVPVLHVLEKGECKLKGACGAYYLPIEAEALQKAIYKCEDDLASSKG